jgi:hypothetical protein
MIDPKDDICCDSECINNANQTHTLCCSKCGRCGNHSHQDCGALDNTVHGRPDPLLE